jgi:hypothetical protein
MPGRHDGGEEPGEHTCHRGLLCAAQEDDAREYDGGGPGCDHFTCQEIVCEYGCAACFLAGASDGGPAAGPATATGPGSLAQVHTCPCGEVLEFGGDYGAPATSQEWHCRNGHSWSRPAAGSPIPLPALTSCAPLTSGDRRAGALHCRARRWLDALQDTRDGYDAVVSEHASCTADATVAWEEHG